MPMKPRISTEACDHAEGAYDFWEDAWRDRQISADEAAGISIRLAELVTVASLVDEAVSEGITVIRRSSRSPLVIRRRNERRTVAA